MFGTARAVLAIGIGGGGDVVGALAVALSARAAGLRATVGGVTWERRPVDPLPGPRRIDELTRPGRRLADCVTLALPETEGPGGFRFAESHMARYLDEPVVLVDPHPGPAAIAAGLATAARALDCDGVVLVDVGGDVLGHGDEPGLASPLCDAVLLAAAAHLPDELAAIGAVFGPGCDGELTPAEVAGHVAGLARHGAVLGAWGITREELPILEAAVAEVPTEASANALRCARGETGLATMRGGRRSAELGPHGATTWFFDAREAIALCPLAAAVAGCDSLEEADALLGARGIRTEWAYERDAARAG